MIERKQSAAIHPAKAAFREFVRTALHYPIFNHETIDHFGGLRKMQDGLTHGVGAVIIYTHFSEVDPVWYMNSATKNSGAKNVPLLEPIAIDRTYGGTILKIGAMGGVDVVPIVTPDAKERADEKGETDVKQGDGLGLYMEKVADALQTGKLVTTPYFATREAFLSVSKQGVVTKLIYGMKKRGITNFNIHFAAAELPHTEYYGNKRKFNLFQKYKIHHGETYSYNEFMELAAGKEIPGEKTGRRQVRALLKLEQTAHNELFKIAPPNYLASRNLFVL